MQFNCHIRLGKLLSREFNIRGAAKAAFLWGNVEPDIAFTSHFCRRPNSWKGTTTPSPRGRWRG